MNTLEVESKDGLTKESAPKRTLLETVQLLLNTLNHALIGFVFMYTVWVCCKNGFQLIFTWHVFLCVFGDFLCLLLHEFAYCEFHVLMAESIMAFYSSCSWAVALTHPQRKTTHWVMQVVGAGSIIVGIALEIYFRETRKKKHFSSPHSILGLIALVLLVLSMCNGLGSLYAVELRKRMKPMYIKLSHHFIGLACFIIGMASLFIGYSKKIFKHNTSPELLATLQIMTILVILLSVLGVLRTIISHVRTLLR